MRKSNDSMHHWNIASPSSQQLFNEHVEKVFADMSSSNVGQIPLDERMPLGARMKKYEHRCREFVPVKEPVIIRVDGKAFHSFTKFCNKPFDDELQDTFYAVCEYLLKEIQCCKMIYHQSDEISLVLSDMDTDKTEPWFNNNIQKIASVTASMVTHKFNDMYKHASGMPALFDARVFTLPKEEVPNYFICRMQDWKRNSISMIARAHFSSKQLFKKNIDEVKQMLLEKKIDYDKDTSPVWKYGTLMYIDKYIHDGVTNTETRIAHMPYDYDKLNTIFYNSHGWFSTPNHM